MAASRDTKATHHFFGSRQHGEVFYPENTTAKSEQEVKKQDDTATKLSWRYGKGNCYSPFADGPEAKNVGHNISCILKQHGIETEHAHPGIILESQYNAGITVVDERFLQTNTTTERIVVKGDGLFSTLRNVPLLNKSGDAHAIIFESEEAVGIIVGSWMGLSKNIVNKMLDLFKSHNISPNKITVSVGPGLGSDSYSIGKPTEEALEKAFGKECMEIAMHPKQGKKGDKYVFDVKALMVKYGEIYGFKVNVSESANTFDKTAWKQIKTKATEQKNPQLLVDYYASLGYFSARQYTRADRVARRISAQSAVPLPTQLVERAEGFVYEDITTAGKDGRYSETGRCLNGVMMS